MTHRVLFPDFFVVGVPRSGTTLARAIIDGHSRLIVPSETGFLPRLLRIQGLWWGGRTVRTEVFRRLIFANGRLTRAGLSPYQVRARLRTSPPATPAEAISRIYECFAAAEDPRIRVGDKTPAYVQHTQLLSETFPRARFIHMVRHPLAVAASLRHQPWGPDDPVASAALWVRAMRAIADSDLAPDRLITLRLEDLIADPAAVVGALAAFLDVDAEPAMFHFHDRAGRIMQQNFHPAGHAGLREPLRQTRDWQNELDPQVAADAWSIVAEQAERMGYRGPKTAPRSMVLANAERRLKYFKIKRSWRRFKTAARVLRG